jgi:hypothetical protein
VQNLMLKSYQELRALNVEPYCDYREGKDDKGKKIMIPYLNWAKCVDLLHENGAETVYFTPLRTPGGSFVFESCQTENKDGRRCGSYFVAVEIHIDDKVFTMDYPVLNGNLVVYADTLNQLRISNCHARAFVKGVAIHTGLGFGLWTKDAEESAVEDDLSRHSLFAVKKRIEQELTRKLQRGMDINDIYHALGIREKQFQTMMGYFDTLNKLEQRLKAL